MTHPALSLIDSIVETRAQLARDPLKLARLRSLQRWQVQRLRRSYEDLYALPRYRDAIEFFAQDLYGPHVHEQRDAAVKRVLEPWQNVLPRRAMQAVTAALQLEALTQQLDLAVLDALGGCKIESSVYARAYQAVGRRSDRERQIALIVECGRALDALIVNPWVRRALRLATIPARIAGVAELHEFLVHGYEAFAKMNGASDLLRTIEFRETAVMNNLFTGAAEPFMTSQIEERSPSASA